MNRILAESGLKIKRSDLYEYLQDAMAFNVEAYLKSIILSPGLRIAESDDFQATVQGSKIVVKLGAAIFDDYRVFVPPSGDQNLEIDMGDVDLDASTQGINLWLVPEDVDSHLQYKMLSKDMYYTVRQTSVKIVVANDTTSMPGCYLLASGTVDIAGVVTLTSKVHLSVLRLIPAYRASSWDLASGILPSVQDVAANLVRMSDYAAGSFHGKAINKLSPPCNRRANYCIDVSWLAPGKAEVKSLGGVAYFQIKATPVVNGVEVDQYSLTAIVPYPAADAGQNAVIRIGGRIRVDWGVGYNVRVCRVTGDLDHKIGQASDPVAVMPTQILTPPPITITLDYAYDVGDIIKITHNKLPDCDYYHNVYSVEYTGTDKTDEQVRIKRNLIYSGPIKTVYHKLERLEDKLTVVVDVLDEDHRLIATGIETMEIESRLASWEDIIVIPFPIRSNGWPDLAAGVGVEFKTQNSGAKEPVLVHFTGAGVDRIEPGMEVEVNGTGVPALDTTQIIRDTDVHSEWDYGSYEAMLDLDVTANYADRPGTMYLPTSVELAVIKRRKAFVISRMIVTGIPEVTAATGSSLVVKATDISGSTISVTVDDTGAGEYSDSDITNIFTPNSDVSITLELGEQTLYDPSGLTLLLYCRNVD